MGREIKFRGMNTINGNFVFGHFFVEDGIYKIHATHTIYPVNLSTVGQFTGLKDKNGKEIYEGDVLQTKQGVAYVVWDDAAFALKSPGSEAVDWEHSSVYESAVVICNIHQNLELLKGGGDE